MPKESPGDDTPEVTPGNVDADDGSVTVDLDEAAKKEAAASAGKGNQSPPSPEEVEKKVRAEYEEKLQASERQAAAQRRIAEKLERERAGYQAQPQQPRPEPTPEPPPPEDELDKLVEKDWKAAVRKLGRQEAEAYIKEWQTQQAQQKAFQERASRVEQSKDRVVERYPDLDPIRGDEDSDVSQLYNEVLQSDQTLLQNEHGPEIAMYRMEQLAAERGIRIGPQAAPKTPAKSRGNVAGALPPSRSAPSSGGRFVLSREQREYCDLHGIPYETFAKMARATEDTGGVEV